MSETFAIIKPTAVRLKQIGQIITCIEEAGFVISFLRTIDLELSQAQELYQEHSERDFFDDLCVYMMSGPIVVMRLYYEDDEGVEAWKKWREVIGATNPEEAKEGTIRKKFAISRRENAVHGSDSAESAEREIGIFFGTDECLPDNWEFYKDGRWWCDSATPSRCAPEKCGYCEETFCWEHQSGCNNFAWCEECDVEYYCGENEGKCTGCGQNKFPK